MTGPHTKLLTAFRASVKACIASLHEVVADILNALMAIPNLIALLAMSSTIFAVTKRYFACRG